MNIKKATLQELKDLEIELRLKALDGSVPTPPGVDNAETPEERQRIWEKFVTIVYYQRQLGRSRI